MAIRTGNQETGSATVGFLFTALLSVTVFLGLLQTAVVLHTRATLIDIAGEAARVAGRHGASAQDGTKRAHELLHTVPGDAHVHVEHLTVGTGSIVRVTISSDFPILGGFGINEGLTVSGHGVVEEYEDL
ncbi:TadE/TadG family type IV pilus assembly protein [Timonella sp. A28]|uniref:TadE/TadG family type IV pilus assembly protein n=1 Tax=Timonella sp. A28 TaxID=3442640 RepID=UPI003EB9FF8D